VHATKQSKANGMTKQAFQRRACTVQRFAREYDIHPVTVYRWLRDGELKGMKIGGRTLVLLESLPPALEPKRKDTVLDEG
jgi:transposase-like protein